MSNVPTPYRSRRRRRCALGRHCPRGGRIAVGETALRFKPHRYVHADDARWFRETAEALMGRAASWAEILTDAFDAFVEQFASLSYLFVDLGLTWAPIIRDVAVETRAAVMDVCGDNLVAVGPTPDPLTVRVVACDTLDREEAGDELWRVHKRLYAEGYSVEDDGTADGAALLVTWTHVVDETREETEAALDRQGVEPWAT